MRVGLSRIMLEWVGVKIGVKDRSQIGGYQDTGVSPAISGEPVLHEVVIHKRADLPVQPVLFVLRQRVPSVISSPRRPRKVSVSRHPRRRASPPPGLLPLCVPHFVVVCS
jgi:hypothetical protein